MTSKMIFALTVGALLLCGSNVSAEAPLYSWQYTDSYVALKNADRTVWQFYHGTDKDKPFFHPLSLIDGTQLTDESHKNHPWHHALWFSWKFINGVNFWEESKATGKAKGKNAWSDVEITARPEHTATISMSLSYYVPDEAEPILPAVICERPHTLKAGDSMTLKYRVGVHNGRWTDRVLRTKCENYKER